MKSHWNPDDYWDRDPDEEQDTFYDPEPMAFVEIDEIISACRINTMAAISPFIGKSALLSKRSEEELSEMAARFLTESFMVWVKPNTASGLHYGSVVGTGLAGEPFFTIVLYEPNYLVLAHELAHINIVTRKNTKASMNKSIVSGNNHDIGFYEEMGRICKKIIAQT